MSLPVLLKKPGIIAKIPGIPSRLGIFVNKSIFMDTAKLKKKVNLLKNVMGNTDEYRGVWEKSHKEMIINTLQKLIDETGIHGEVAINDRFEGLEAISLALETRNSGIFERITDTTKRALIRNGGVLTYHQLFNGKIGILIGYPYIEGIGQPKVPKTVEIVRPEELKEINILRQVELFVDEVTEWEDFDDDKQSAQKIGFHHIPGVKQEGE
jgi:hypothetical protein